MTDSDDIIRASEIAQYAFCARSWWLGRVLGYRPSNVDEMAAGLAAHRAHGRRVEAHHLLGRLALALLVLAAVLLLAWAMLTWVS